MKERLRRIYRVSVAIDSAGLVLAVGARFNDGNDLTDTDRGHVRLFRFNGTDWEHDQDLDGDDPGDTRGSSVAFDGRGETVAIGSTLAYGFGFSVSGDVTVYTKPSVYAPWQQVGDDLEGEFESDNNGFAVSISEDGTIVAAGAVANGENSGHARVHHLEGDEWIQMGQDLDGDPGELSGACVSLSRNGTLLAIGGPEYSGGPDIAGGRVRVFGFDGELWSQVGSDIVATSGAWSLLGISCQMSGDGTLVAVGAPGASVNDTATVGLVQVYQWKDSNWTQIGQDLIGDAAVDQFGVSLALSVDGTTLAVGANTNDANGELSGQIAVFRLSETTVEDE